MYAPSLRLAQSSGQKVDSGVRLEVMWTHAELAARISTHREAVTRELNRLQKAGIIARDEKTWVITSIEKLREMVREAIEN